MRIPTRLLARQIGRTFLLLAAAVAAAGQDSPAPDQLQSPAAGSEPPAAQTAPATAPLLEFKDSDVKFALRDLMDIVKDNRHEGWVLVAYPDPKTRRPLIGAGFSLDLPEREHPQRDPLNSHPFLEPSSAELWQAAGLDAERLQNLLGEFHQRLAAAASPRKYRKRMGTWAPQVTDEEAARLLRIALIQAIYNARGYCRDFDSLTASQQMALSQLVYQMGVNLEQFSGFLKLINSGASTAAAAELIASGTSSESEPGASTAAGADATLDGNAAQSESSTRTSSESSTETSVAPGAAAGTDPEYWREVQRSLIESQWARVYRARAVSVIAMLDPGYSEAPVIAERRVSAVLRPAVTRGHGNRSGAGHTVLAASKSRGAAAGRKTRRARTKRKT